MMMMTKGEPLLHLQEVLVEELEQRLVGRRWERPVYLYMYICNLVCHVFAVLADVMPCCLCMECFCNLFYRSSFLFKYVFHFNRS